MRAMNRDRAWLRRGVALVLLSAGIGALPEDSAHAQGVAAANAAQPSRRDAKSETGMKIMAPFTVAAIGDIFAPQPVFREEAGFQKLVDTLRRADVAFANFESSLVDFRLFNGPVGATVAPLEMGDSVKALGIDLVNHANNQTFDGGLEGMVSTDSALDRLGIVHAGTGRNLQEARAARYLETPKGRVGLVGMFSMDDSSNYGPNFLQTAASYRLGNLAGAPGLNPLRLTAFHVVSAEQLQSMKQTALGNYGDRPNSATPAEGGRPERFRYFDEWYEAGADAGDVHYDMSPGDEKDIYQSIRNGKISADLLIATLHSHQTSTYRALGWGGVDHGVPDFLVRLAHGSIDAGADLFVVHGVHALRGVEIYNGKPVFYGVSSFIFQFGVKLGPGEDVLANEQLMAGLETPPNQEALLTTTRFENGRLAEVRLYPVYLGGSRLPISQMGIPTTPAPEEAQRILRSVQEYSKPFGTKIAIENNVGVIRIDTR